ncbi:hypothetical protein VTI74DRAFT_6334 [Chaetomium olivicolor]
MVRSQPWTNSSQAISGRWPKGDMGGNGGAPAGILSGAPTAQELSSTLDSLYRPYSNKTPVFQNDTIIRHLLAHSGSLSKRAAANDLPEVCISNCDTKAPSGQYADPTNTNCPMNACCSQYGFCGSPDDFCGTGCREGFGVCGPPPTLSCVGRNSAGARRIGYYEAWATTRPCDVVTPMDANAGSLFSRFTVLKAQRPFLQTWLSVSAWYFNDAINTPNTQHAFGDMASFDGVDIDWEYPVAGDRGGVKADFENLPVSQKSRRSWALFGRGLGITITLPSSYCYLQHFDVLSMEPYLDWFNFMSYEIHGVWDSTAKFTGPYIRPHTNLTEVQDGLSLLWRAGVSPSKVALSLGCSLGVLRLEAGPPLLVLSIFTFSLTTVLDGAICAPATLAAIAIGFAIILNIVGWLFGGSPSRPNVGALTTITGRALYGQWPILDFNGGATSTSCDCAVTYTCRYSMGLDEVCDNQR